jgi:hypothetical protein
MLKQSNDRTATVFSDDAKYLEHDGPLLATAGANDSWRLPD